MGGENQRVLIDAPKLDSHARLVRFALERKGHEVLQAGGDQYPTSIAINFEFEAESCSAELHDDHGHRYPAASVDCVWNRRPMPPDSPDYIHPDDDAFVRRELRMARDSLDPFLESAFWVNGRESARRAECKPFQLSQAIRAGLMVPETLVSNSPKRIRDFLSTHDSAIYKPLFGGVWDSDGGRRATYTSRVSASQLPDDRMLNAVPGIFQGEVNKDYEVRAQFFGDTCLAVKINSPDLDWRRRSENNKIAKVTVPPVIHSSCRRMMKSMSLVAGAFDFIVTPDGEWVFLEVNQAGQFLFMEAWCEDLPVLDAFSEFLLSGNEDFRYQPSGRVENLAETAREMGMQSVLPQASAGSAVKERAFA